MAYLMGIDLGTSSLKVIVTDEDGNIHMQSSKNYQIDSPYNGYAEQNPETWWKACCYCIQDVLQKISFSTEDIKAVSFSGQMHGLVPLDENGNVVRPSILHCDARTAAQVAYVKETLGEQLIENKVLNPIYAGFLLPSLIWVRDKEPELYKKIKHVCLPKDYIKYKMTHRMVSDYSDASATLAYDIEGMCWLKEVLYLLDIPEEIFPECEGTCAVIGVISKEAAKETGLSEKTLVINGGADQIMQGIGNGITTVGMATVNIGTSGQVCFQSDRVIKNPQLNTNTFCGYKSGRWIAMGAIMNAGLSLKWFNKMFGKTNYEVLNEEVAKVNPGSGGVIFLPYLNGERTPHLNPNISAMFIGLNLNTQRGEMARAVMEGVSFALMQSIEICQTLGLQATQLVASGGGARSEPWLQMQADIYNIPLKTSKVEEQAGLGAVIAAGVGAGIYKDIEQGCKRVVKYKDKIYEPNANTHKVYEEYYQLFKEVYTESKGVLQKVTELGRK